VQGLEEQRETLGHTPRAGVGPRCPSPKPVRRTSG
jgi:hypothetical protein